jgi:hypothetical protein
MENENPFKKIGLPSQEVPKDLKNKVMEDVNTVKLLLELSNLFTLNYVDTIEGMFKTLKRSSRKEKESNKEI